MRQTSLVIATDRQVEPLPAEFITQSSAILAKKGAGKTNAAIVLLEEAFACGVPVVSIDPKGDHWGVRAGADGTPKGGLPVVVFGGLHADVPLEPTAGAYVAELIRSTRLSAVLDVSEFTIGERARFLAPFADQLYRYDSRDPMLLILEEAHEYIPQMVRGEEAKMVGAFERLVKLGRSKGLGVRGDPVRFKFRMRHTYDAGATPKVGESPRPPATLADVDLVAVTKAMAETIEKAKADDPKALRAKVADLERQLRARPVGERVEVPVEVVREVEKIVEVPALAADERQLMETIQSTLGGLAEMMPTYRAIVGRVSAPPARPQLAVPRVREVATAPAQAVQTAVPRATTLREPGEGPLPKAQRLVLTVLAQRGAQTQQQVAMLTGYAVNGGGFNNALGSLRSTGFMEGSKDSLQATQAGLDALGDFEPMPTGQALVDFWLAKFGKAERLILEYLVSVWPDGADRETIAAAAGYEPNGGGFNNAIGKLRTLALVRGERGQPLMADESLGQAAT